MVRAMIDEAIGSYNIDPTRIVIQGRRAGGAIGYLTAFNHRDIIRGIVPIDVAIPRRTNLKPNRPCRTIVDLRDHSHRVETQARHPGTAQAT